MAIVKEFRASNGALIRVDDRGYAGVSKEEMERRKKLVIDTATEIAINIELRRRAAAEREMQEAKAEE